MLKLSSSFTIRFIYWIEPIPEESLYNYSVRLSEQIEKNEEYILIGMSLGGMVAIELNKFLFPIKTIIISSVSTYREYPFLIRLIRKLKINKITPTFLLKTPSPVAYWFFSAKTPREKFLIKSFMKNVTENYLRWSVNEVVNWKNDFRPDNLIHIHGTADRIFLFKDTFATIRILNGGHLMIHNKAEEISNLLSKFIERDF
jgi:hypothetical protein